jgi:GT2 family glycosyltransferase
LFELYRHRITRIEQHEPNLPKARNAGFAAARGRLIVFVDDDIILPPHAIARLADHFRTSQLKGVSGVVVSESSPEASLRAYARQLGVASMNADRGPRQVEGFIGALMMVPAKVVRRVGGFDELLGRLTPTAYGEDNDFCQRLRRAGIPLWIDPAVRVLHKDHLEGGCGSRTTDPALARKYHMKSMAYIRLKHHGRLGVRGWLQLGRGFVVNRELLRESPGQIVRNLATARLAVKEVRSFMGAGKARGGTGGPFLRPGGSPRAGISPEGKGFVRLL